MTHVLLNNFNTTSHKYNIVLGNNDVNANT